MDNDAIMRAFLALQDNLEDLSESVSNDEMHYVTYRAKLATSEETAKAFLKKKGIEIGSKAYEASKQVLYNSPVMRAINGRLQNPYKFFVAARSGKDLNTVVESTKADIPKAILSGDNLQVLSAIAAIEIVKDSIATLDLIISGKHTFSNIVNLAAMAGCLERALFALTVNDVETRHESKRRKQTKALGDGKRRQKVRSAALEMLQGADKSYFLWDTEKKKGKIKKEALAKKLKPALNLSVRTIIKHLPGCLEDLTD